jgi:hypothetical protein
MTIREITPLTLRCTIGACMSVYETSDGNLIIIGKKIAAETFALLSHKVGEDEDVVMIHRDYLSDLRQTELTNAHETA